MTTVIESTAADELVLKIERVFAAPRDLVFRVWSAPEHLARWWGPYGFRLTRCDMDFRVGGTWRFTMQSADETHVLRAIFTEIEQPRRLAFRYTHEQSGQALAVTVDFIAEDNMTRMIFRETGFTSRADRDGHNRGWSETWQLLSRYLLLQRSGGLSELALGWRQDLPSGVEADIAAARERQSAERVPAERILEIERVFDAPRELIFRLWSSPEHITRFWGPRGLHLSHCEMDFRVGGGWRFCMMPASGKGHWIHGTYEVIEPPGRLSFTYVNDSDGFPMLVTLAFDDEGGRTRMRFRQQAFRSTEQRDGHRGGWTESFDIFDRYLTLLQTGRLPASRLGWRQGEVSGIEADLAGLPILAN